MQRDARQLLANLKLTETSSPLEISPTGAKQLGVALDDSTDGTRIEASLIGHILLADVSSSQ